MTDIPRWGRIVARPHEFLILIRNGTVRHSGQGVSCFKWPWDSVAIIPTSIRKLSFRADQVTLERTGVDVTGLAVYRIADPLLAFRMLDTDLAALTDILRDMFVGATRRIVAGLTLDACITHRKERLAGVLMGEIAPVLAGLGTTADTTPQGWGIILDTIEIQDVRVLSQDVFSRLQAPYREALALDAMVAHDKVLREQARLDAEQHRVAEEVRQALMAGEEARIVAERRRALEARAHEEALEQRALAAKRAAGELEAEMTRLQRSAHTDLTDGRMRELLLTETLPCLATAFRETFDRVNVTTTDASLAALLSAGIDFAREHWKRP